MDTPVLFLIYNRPDTTKKVFEAIKKARPKNLFIAADGPKAEDQLDKSRCDKTRKVIEDIDWKCKTQTLYRDTNLGCKYAVSSSIDWFFKNVDRGIILEDDCLPDQSFFQYCEELLNKYSDNSEIMHISGNNFQQKNKKIKYNGDYYFSLVPHIWGWATWRRAWALYDRDMNKWPEIKKNNFLQNLFNNKAIAYRWENLFQQYWEHKIDSWDGQWAFACFTNHGLCINPKYNLISNIGFNEEATHTKYKQHEYANMTSTNISTPLIHPDSFEINNQADNYTYKNVFNINKTKKQQIKWFLKQNFPVIYTYIKDSLQKKTDN